VLRGNTGGPDKMQIPNGEDNVFLVDTFFKAYSPLFACKQCQLIIDFATKPLAVSSLSGCPGP